MSVLVLILLSTFSVSLVSFVGAALLSLKEKLLKKIMLYLVALSAGVLMGTAFLHLIPEGLEKSSNSGVFLSVLLGIILFLLIEKIFYWRHCHKGDCPIHSFAYLNLVGDGIHNFLDGLIIGAGFVADINLGFAITIAVVFHEIPQEIGDFGVLIYGGFKRTRALFFNFLTALTAILGGILGFYIKDVALFLMPLAAGGFLYIAASDLIPEIRKKESMKAFLINFLIIILGILISYWFSLDNKI